MSITRELARFFAAPSPGLPAAVATAAKMASLDTLGCAIGALNEMRVRNIATRLVKAAGPSSADLGWGHDRHLAVLDAILVNATYAHILEMDDVHKGSKVHAGAIVVPAAVTLGAFLNAPGARVLDAIVAGYEVAHRIGAGLGVKPHRVRGWHATSTCGVFGAAAAASVLLGLDEDTFVSALGLAGTQAAGVWAFTADGAENKPFHAGAAARAGVLSAFLAEAGLRGPSQILEAEDGGLLKAMSSEAEADRAAIVEGLGQDWYVGTLTVKPFACCRSMHAPIEAVLQLRARQRLAAEAVEGIDIRTYDFAVDQCGRLAPPANRSEAQFGMAHGVAVALVDGQAAPAQFEADRFADETVLALASRVRIHRDPGFQQRYPHEWGAAVTVTLRNGQTIEEEIRVPKGDPENPLDGDDLRAKFTGLASGIIGQERTAEAVALIERIEELPDVSRLSRLFRLP